MADAAWRRWRSQLGAFAARIWALASHTLIKNHQLPPLAAAGWRRGLGAVRRVDVGRRDGRGHSSSARQHPPVSGQSARRHCDRPRRSRRRFCRASWPAQKNQAFGVPSIQAVCTVGGDDQRAGRECVQPGQTRAGRSSQPEREKKLASAPRSAVQDLLGDARSSIRPEGLRARAAAVL